MSTTATKRINVTFPVDVLENLRELVPKRERNKFIVEAVETAIRHENWGRVLAELRENGPIWKDEDHPDMLIGEDIDRWVRNLREASMPRTWDEMIAEDEEDVVVEPLIGQESERVRQPA